MEKTTEDLKINPQLDSRREALDKLREHLKNTGLYKQPYDPDRPKEPYKSTDEPPEGEPIDADRVPF